MKSSKKTTLEITQEQLLKFNSVKIEVQDLKGRRIKNEEAFDYLLEFYSEHKYMAKILT